MDKLLCINFILWGEPVPTPQKSQATGLLKLAAPAYCQSADRELIILFEVNVPQRLTHQRFRGVVTLSAY